MNINRELAKTKVFPADLTYYEIKATLSGLNMVIKKCRASLRKSTFVPAPGKLNIQEAQLENAIYARNELEDLLADAEKELKD